jgi:hypothetical protein
LDPAYGGYLAIVYALVPESTTATADELPEIGYYFELVAAPRRLPGNIGKGRSRKSGE